MSWSERTAPSRGAVDRRALGALAVVWLALEAGVLFGSPAVHAASVSGGSISGGANTASVGGVLYAKTGASLTLNITTSGDTQCVELDDAVDAVLTSGSGKTTWTHTFARRAAAASRPSRSRPRPRAAAAGAAARAPRRATARSPSCSTTPARCWPPRPPRRPTTRLEPHGRHRQLDRRRRRLRRRLRPHPGHDRADRQHGRAGPDLQRHRPRGQQRHEPVTVRLDKAAPSITGRRTPAPNANGWNNTDVAVGFSCSDPLSGVKSCTGGQTLTSTPAAGQTVTGSAEDTAGNTATAAVGPVKIDTDAPTLSGRATGEPGTGGWYTGDVTIRWTAGDEKSGVDGGAPADSTITAEGEDLTVTRTVADLAGNQTTSASAPVKVDRTPPATTVSAPEGWNRSAVDVELGATDNLSGVAGTSFRLDGGEAQTGTTAAIAGDGVHTLEYWSADWPATPSRTRPSRSASTARRRRSRPACRANPTPTAGTATTSPSPSRAPTRRRAWPRCGPDQAVTTEGAGQDVEGTATDNAGNSATAHGSVSLDRTRPEVGATADRAPNQAGWYADDVTVAFAATDELSGVDTVADPVTLGEGAGQTATGTASTSPATRAAPSSAASTSTRRPPRSAARRRPPRTPTAGTTAT